ncbi:MAG: ATP-binding protein [Myxococcales bacterium]
MSARAVDKDSVRRRLAILPAEPTSEDLELEKARLQATVRALRAAVQVTESVASAFQRERILAAVTDALTRSFGAACARVWLVGEPDRCGSCEMAHRCHSRKQCLHLVEHGGLGPLDRVLARVPIGDFSVGRVAAYGGMVATDDLGSEPGLADPDWARIERLRSFSGHPLVHEGRLLGVVAMWSREPLRDEVLEALRILARHAATAIAGAKLIEDVREQSARSQAVSRQLEALVEASRSGIVLVDRGGRAAVVNRSFRNLFALGDREVVGAPIGLLEDVLRPLVASGELSLGQTVDEDREISVNLPGEPKPRIFRRYSTAALGAGGEVVGSMVVFDDVTNAHEVDRMKSEFISTVSHELRTPLTSIKGSMALVLDGSSLDEETRELVEVTKRNADRLVRLVNDILDVSKIEAGRLELDPAPTDVAALCAEAVQGIDGFAKKVGVTVKSALADGLPPVRADRDRIVQVLTNLLSNALKFSPKAGSVDLLVEQKGNVVRFEVRDRGPGIPEDFRAKLFTRFAQSDRARREQEGTGLGLAICRALVLAHGGEIGVESEPGKGATFFFTLPVERSEA